MKVLLVMLSRVFMGGAAGFLGHLPPHHGTYTLQRAPRPDGAADGLLTGIVLNQGTQQPLELAVVSVNQTLLMTDAYGRFRYEGPAGRYTLRAGFIGYRRVDTRPLRLRAGEQVALTFWVTEEQDLLY